MLLKNLTAKRVKDSRKQPTIQVIVKSSKGKFKTSAPSGKSKGKYEVNSYVGNISHDVRCLNDLDIKEIDKLKVKKFDDLIKLERLVKGKIGGNSLFALEASFLKALAKDEGKDLYDFLGGKKFKIKSVGNAVEGGMHSNGIKGKKPDFQEFLFISDIKTNALAYKLVKRFLKSKQKSDEGAYVTNKSNEKILGIMKEIRDELKQKGKDIEIGLDLAASSFYKDGKYDYENPSRKLSKDEQIDYIEEIIKLNNVFYIEDPLNENDFSGFKELLGKVRKRALIVGDDLIVTNSERLKKAIRFRAVNAVIVKPNQIGSLLKVKEIIDIAKKYGIKTIMSHRSGETKDDTIADIAVGWNCDFIKTGIYGSVRESKLKRLIKIEKELKR